MSEHAKYSPSQLSRIIRCPGSVDFVDYLIQKNEIPEEETTTYAEEGTMLHAQIARMIEFKRPNVVLSEQQTAIEECLDFLETKTTQYGASSGQVEQQMSLKGFGIDNCEGTADVCFEGTEPYSLHIIDWKFGRGVFVPVEKNEQLMAYLLGAAGNLEKLESYEELWIHVGQPRLDNFNSYKCNIDELMGLINAIKNAQKSHDIVAGEKQCFWCRAKNRCAEYETLVRGKAALVFQVNDLMKQNEYPFDKMAKVLLLEKDFNKIFKAIKDHLQELNNEQLKAIGMKRVMGRSTRQWASEAAAAKYLIDEYGAEPEDIMTEPALKSPAQIEGKFKKAKKDVAFQKFVVKPTGAPVLASVNDPRPEFQNDATSVFQRVLENK